MPRNHELPLSRLRHSSSSSTSELICAVRSGLGVAANLNLPTHTLAAAKRSALETAASLKQSAKLITADVARGDVGGMLMIFIARSLITCYFVSAVYDSYTSFKFMQQPEVKQRAARWPEHYPAAPFPWFGLFILLPAALAAAAGFLVSWTGGLLLAWELLDSAQLVWQQLLALLIFGAMPNELMVKRLAMLGSVALMLAHNAKEQRRRLNSHAGLLLADEPAREPSGIKSAVLLGGRLLLACLFIIVGITQVQRIIARDWLLSSQVPHSALWERDGHDNNFLLLEFVLALPLAAGWQTPAVCRMLALVLAAEAVTCWQWFMPGWPTWAYAAHVRLHFCTNLGCAGGLLLLGSLGAGRFAVDALLQKKQQ